VISGPLICNPEIGDKRVCDLGTRLRAFYSSTTEYSAFQEPAVHDREWRAMLPLCDELLRQRERIAILEVGAGRSAFGDALGSRRPLVQYDVQDVTAANEEYLRGIADRVYMNPVEQLSGQYDIIFSTFVLEHVATPVSFLENVRRLLKPGGWHVVFCPRYDNPAYQCPSLRRLPLGARVAAAVQLWCGQILSMIDRRPRFYLNTAPAVLEGPWFRDADAVHVVTRRAVELWHRHNGFCIKRLQVPATTRGEWLQVVCMLLADAFQKV